MRSRWDRNGGCFGMAAKVASLLCALGSPSSVGHNGQFVV